jgi:hypothetical protein
MGGSPGGTLNDQLIQEKKHASKLGHIVEWRHWMSGICANRREPRVAGSISEDHGHARRGMPPEPMAEPAPTA